MKLKVLIVWAFLVCLYPSSKDVSFYGDHAHGWHWYEKQESEDRGQEPVQESVTRSQQSGLESSKPKTPKEIVTAYREELENRLAEAWLRPTPQKIKAYQEMQQDMLNRSQTFSEVWMQSVFLNPKLDSTIANPVNQKARHIQLDLKKKQTAEVIRSLSQEYGLFFFFSGNCEFCHEFAPIVKMFSEQYGWQVLAISLDGGAIAEFPDAKSDNGLFEQWQVGVMPALYAVNPNTGHVIPVAHGMISIDQMEVRVMSLAGKMSN